MMDEYRRLLSMLSGTKGTSWRITFVSASGILVQWAVPLKLVGIANEHSIQDPFTGEITVEINLL